MWKSSIGLRLSFKKRTTCTSSVSAWAFVIFENDWMGSKRWTWVLNLLKSFGSQILDLGLDSNKVMKASRVEPGLQFKQSDVNLKLWTWAFIHARSDLSSRKVMWASSLELGLQFKWSHVRYHFLKKWVQALDLDFHFMLFWIPKLFFKHRPKSRT